MAKKAKETETSNAQSLITDFDIHLFKSGKHFKLYEKLGARIVTFGKQEGAYFAVWAPNAKAVSVIGNFNHWGDSVHKLNPRWDQSGIWEGFFTDIKHGEAYKYAIHSNTGEYLEKADPFAMYFEQPPRTASIIWSPKYEWKDQSWLSERKLLAGKPKPYSVYEVHFGSWKRTEENKSLTYPEMAHDLVKYVKDNGFTHVEFLPLMEHPL
jgi:1,4-alpha-glucan branching enzyme